VFIPLRIGITRCWISPRESGLQIGLCTSSQADRWKSSCSASASSQGLTQPLHTYFSVMVTGDRSGILSESRALFYRVPASGRGAWTQSGCGRFGHRPSLRQGRRLLCVGLRSNIISIWISALRIRLCTRIDELVESNWLRTGLEAKEALLRIRRSRNRTRLWLDFYCWSSPASLFGSGPTDSDQGEILYNGVQLPALWPPASIH
jgi:hypothetical protein